MTRISLLLFFAAIALVACGDEIETSRLVDDSGVGLLALGETIDQLPCDESNKGKFVYVADSSEVFYCIDGEWTRVNGEDGADGKDGKNGTDGKDGKDATNGSDGAKCDVAGFEDGFTILCGDNKTVVNLKSLMPDTCAISDETEKGFKVTCGKDSVWQKAGKDAREPVRCTIKDAGDGTALFVCGPDTVVVARAQCAGEPYDPDKFFCYNDLIADLCGGKTYDASKYFCHLGTLMDLCGGASYDPATRFCKNEVLYDFCGIQDYDPETEFCEDYRIFDKCPDKYNILTHFCYEGTLREKCGGEIYDPAKQFCTGMVVYDKCGGNTYDPSKYFCEEGTLYDRCRLATPYVTKVYFCVNGRELHTKCGGETYTPSTHFCLDGKTYSKCGTNSSYDPTAFTCRNNVLYGTCGSKEYKVATQVCVGSTILDKCGADGAYDATKYFCQNGEMYPKCNGQTYDAQKKFCRDGKLHDKCGTDEFDPSRYFCADKELYAKCDGETFDVKKYFCVNDKLNERCGDAIYDIENYFCYNKVVYPKCGGKKYSPNTQFCMNKTVYDLCDGHVYSPKSNGRCIDGTYYYDVGSTHYFIDFRDNRVNQYVTVGKLKWMVNFLQIEYTDRTSWCGKHNPAECAAHGRLYTWAAAVDSLGRYSSTGKGSGNNVDCRFSNTTKVRGICPSGWRLPMVDEVPTSADIAKYPEAQALALDGPGHSHDNYYASGDFCGHLCSAMWTSTCYDKTRARARQEARSTSEVHFYSPMNYQKSDLLGVRCVKDN